MIHLHWSYILYAVGALPILIWIGYDFFTSEYNYFESSPKYSMGLSGFVGFIVLALWTLIWGGFFIW